MSEASVQATQRETAQAPAVESRWPAIIALVVFVGLLAELPGRFRIAPPWVTWVGLVGMVGPMLGSAIFKSPRALRLERILVLTFVGFSGILLLLSLQALVQFILFKPGHISGLSLLASGVAIWCGNVLLFTIIYWLIDGGGPESRAAGTVSEWLFPQASIPKYAGWRPKFADYLFLAFETATAFSACDVQPMSRRMKLIMLGESVISLVTVVIIAGRAINILQ